MIRYEDFSNSPNEVMEKACTLLEIPYSDIFSETFSVFKLTGDSGRKGNTMEPKSRRPISDNLAEELQESLHYRTLREILNYESRNFEPLIQLGLSGGGAALQLSANNGAAQGSLAVPPAPAFKGTLQRISDELKAEVEANIRAAISANNPNPYAHNRTMTPVLNKALRDFAEQKLKRQGLKAAYIDYLAAKAIQIERNCTGRLATTVQDAVARQLVAECVTGDGLCILEIGALYGISLAILYNHAVTRFQDVQVACLDPFDGYYGKAIDAVLNSPVNDLTFRRNMQLANVPLEDYRLIKYYSKDPAAIAAARELPINLLIIDGDHSYEGVKFDFDNYFPILRSGGYVIFDDYNAKEWPGVQKFIDEDLDEVEDLEYLGDVSRTAVARKKHSVPA